MHRWAVQVRADELGAHLVAYASTLLAINALRLCNRFGTGRACHVNKLPTELITIIEENLVQAAREEALQTWSKLLQCWEDKCYRIADHYTREEEIEF